jgi:hypothetical protein
MNKKSVTFALILVNMCAIAALGCAAKFLSRFDSRWWPEMFCHGQDWIRYFDLLILANIAIAVASSLSLMKAREFQAGASWLVGPFALAGLLVAGNSIAQVTAMAGWQYDVFCPGQRQWLTLHVLLNTFATPLGGYLVVIVVAIPFASGLRRIRGSAPEGK